MSKTPWQEWKEKQATRGVSPLDFFRRDTEYALSDLQEERFNICKSCEYLTAVTNQCKQCGCFMNLKVKLAEAKCPLGKW